MAQNGPELDTELDGELDAEMATERVETCDNFAHRGVRANQNPHEIGCCDGLAQPRLRISGQTSGQTSGQPSSNSIG
jgi:hypothetical protein